MADDDFTNGLDKPTQEAIGMRLEWMCHTARSIHDRACALIGDGKSEGDSSKLWAIQELASGQARELELLADRLQGSEMGYYAEHFKDAALV